MVLPQAGNRIFSTDGGCSGYIPAALRTSVAGSLPGWNEPAVDWETKHPSKAWKLRRGGYRVPPLCVVDLLVAFEPPTCKRVVKLTYTRTAIDFAHSLRQLVDIHCSHCEKIMLVMDNLNIHSIASLYKVFKPAQAREIIQQLEIHCTSTHASWLNIAVLEIGILSRQCLSQSLASFEEMHHNAE